MKFIIPQNYKFNKKFLGIIDYSTVIINLLWGGLIFVIVDTLFKDINIKIFLFIVSTIPTFILSIVGVGGENILNVLIYIFKFIIKQKILFYDKKE